MNLKNLKSLQALFAALAVCSIANAQDGGGDGLADDPFPADLSSEAVIAVAVQPMSCEEARHTAWFERELARADGETAYLASEIACGEERIAQVNHDAIE
jgi:hypothetical protein